jgi:hypothetical protein
LVVVVAPLFVVFLSAFCEVCMVTAVAATVVVVVAVAGGDDGSWW